MRFEIFFVHSRAVRIGSFLFATILMLLFGGCASNPKSGKAISRSLTGKGIKSESQLVRFFMASNPSADKSEVQRLAKLYIRESSTEGINSDCAFVQMCHETGFLKFGNLVTPDMHNYGGLGAIDADHPGERFDTEQLGVRAHVQHLHAYATPATKTLRNPLVDTRYKWVTPRGKAPTIYELTGTWATDENYGTKLNTLLSRLEAY